VRPRPRLPPRVTAVPQLMSGPATAGSATRRMLLRRGLTLEYLTPGWNVIGCVVLLAAAVSVRSVALAGFGVDSVTFCGGEGEHRADGEAEPGVALNAVAGCWWADPASATIIFLYAAREARHAWQESG
jgi:hypothetical protein